MKENYNIEFDEIFRQELGNASAPVPGGVWEGISSSLGSGTATATASAATKVAIWMKAAIAVSVIGVAGIVTYQFTGKNDVKPVTPVIQDAGSSKPGESAMEQEITTTGQQDIAGKENEPGSDKSAKAQEIPSFQPPRIVEEKSNEPETVVFRLDDIRLNDWNQLATENSTPGNAEKAKADSIRTADDRAAGNDEPYVPEKAKAPIIVDSSYIYIPNVVTPNGDGQNDEYLIDIKGEESVHIIIYTSKYVKLFETKNKLFSWDCKLPSGEIVPEGTYIVKVIYKFRNKEQKTTSTKLHVIK